MSTAEIIAAIESIQSLTELLNETEAEIETLKDSIKQTMLDREIDTLEAGTHIVRWTTVLTTRFDSTAFKKKHEELYKEYTKQTTSRRFTISK